MAKHKKNPAAVALGRLGGLAKSKAKSDAVRKNGAKGGRPRLCLTTDCKKPALKDTLYCVACS